MAIRHLLFCAGLLAACSPTPERGPADAALPDSTAAAPERVLTIAGFSTPESVLHDAELDVYFVSNINGGPDTKDNNGFISRLLPDGTIDSLHFISGGEGGVTLHAPKGSALVADTLWVADIDAVRGFNRRTGAPVATIPVPNSAFLNDLAVGPDGALYVTETGFRFTSGSREATGLDAVFRIDGRSVTPFKSSGVLPTPNGITVNRAGSAMLLVSAGDPIVRTWQPGDTVASESGRATGGGDGVEVLADGRVLVSSWGDSTIAVVGETPEPLITGVESPADFGVDRKRNRLLVPSFMGNRVEVWELK